MGKNPQTLFFYFFYICYRIDLNIHQSFLYGGKVLKRNTLLEVKIILFFFIVFTPIVSGYNTQINSEIELKSVFSLS